MISGVSRVNANSLFSPTMTLDDLLARTATEPDWAEERTVSVPGPRLLAEVAAKGGMPLLEFMKHPDRTPQRRVLRRGHRLGPGLSQAELESWIAAWPQHPLPADLSALLLRANGIHLWADLDSGRAYYGISPLAEWQDAGSVGWAHLFSSPPTSALVISYHENGDGYLLLETMATPQPRFVWCDLEDIDHPTSVGHTVSELLDWLWERRAPLDPRR